MVKEPLESDEWRKPHHKKDTKHWCKGKTGRDHFPMISERTKFGWWTCMKAPQWALDRRPERLWLCYHDVTCIRCGKVLQWSLDDWRQCPDLPEEFKTENTEGLQMIQENRDDKA